MLGITYIIVGVLFFMAAIYHEQNFDNDMLPIIFIIIASIDIGIGIRHLFRKFFKQDKDEK